MTESMVSFLTVGEVRTSLEKAKLPPELSRQREAATVWRPLYERLLRSAWDTMAEGWPFQIYGPDWRRSASRIVNDMEQALEEEVKCHFPQRLDSNIGHLLGCVRKALVDPTTLTGREVGLARRILLDSQEKWGALGSRAREQALKETFQGFHKTDYLQWVQELHRLLEPLDPECGIPPALELPKSLPSSLKNKIERALQRPLQVALRQPCSREELLVILQQLKAQPDSAAEFLEQLWHHQPHVVFCSRLRRALNSSLQKPSQLPGSWLSVSPEFLDCTKTAQSNTIYQTYYGIEPNELSSPESFLEACRIRAGEDAPKGAIASEAETLLCGGSFGLFAALNPTVAPLHSSLLCYQYHGEASIEQNTKPYKQLKREKGRARIWRQMVFFLSLCSESETNEFFKRAVSLRDCPELRGLQRCREGRADFTPLPVWIS